MSLMSELLKSHLEDMDEHLEVMREVVIPDHLDDHVGPDWDLLIELRRLQRVLQVIVLQVAQKNRDRIVNGWVGGPSETSPPRSDLGPWPGGRDA